jgi:hypothetical protein
MEEAFHADVLVNIRPMDSLSGTNDVEGFEQLRTTLGAFFSILVIITLGLEATGAERVRSST